MYINFKDLIKLNNNRPFKCILHIGAHEGEELQAYVENGVEEIIWVEGNKNIMGNLIARTSNSKIKQHYICACISDKDNQEVVFNVSNNGQSSSILELGTHQKLYPHINYVQQQYLKTTTIKTLAEQKPNIFDDFKKIDMVNLDIQGAELLALKGFGDLLKYQNIQCIYTEINFEEVYKNCALAKDLDAYLSLFGFKRMITSTPDHYSWGDCGFFRISK